MAVQEAGAPQQLTHPQLRLSPCRPSHPRTISTCSSRRKRWAAWRTPSSDAGSPLVSLSCASCLSQHRAAVAPAGPAPPPHAATCAQEGRECVQTRLADLGGCHLGGRAGATPGECSDLVPLHKGGWGEGEGRGRARASLGVQVETDLMQWQVAYLGLLALGQGDLATALRPGLEAWAPATPRDGPAWPLPQEPAQWRAGLPATQCALDPRGRLPPAQPYPGPASGPSTTGGCRCLALQSAP